MTIRSAIGDFWFGRTRARVLLVVLVAYLVAVGLVLIAQLESTWGKPDQRALVVVERVTGERRSCGRACTCREVLVQLDVADGDPGQLLDCEETYEVGDVLDVRRQRQQPDTVEPAPPPMGEALVAALVAPVLVVLLGGLTLRARRGSPWPST